MNRSLLLTDIFVANFFRRKDAIILDAFKMQVKIFDVTEFRTLRSQDLFQSLNIFLATFQSFRVTNIEGRKVYQSNEFLEPCFRDISQQTATTNLSTICPLPVTFVVFVIFTESSG